jgi:hypothetical protein
LVEYFRVTTNTKLKADAVKQEVEKHKELVVSLFRALAVLSPMAQDCMLSWLIVVNMPGFEAYMAQEVKSGPYREEWNSVIKEQNSSMD